jgi:hypothetical protein
MPARTPQIFDLFLDGLCHQLLVQTSGRFLATHEVAHNGS